MCKPEFRQVVLVSSSDWLWCGWQSMANSLMWVKGHHHPSMGRLVFPSMPQDTRLAWLKTRGTLTHECTTKEEKTAIHLQTSGCVEERLQNTVWLRSSCFLQFLTVYRLAFFPPFSRQREVQFGKASNCLHILFLVSKQVVLFSAPISAETAIICPL